MKRLLIIPILFIAFAVQAQIEDPRKGHKVPKPEAFVNKIVEIDPIIPGEENVLWKLMDNGKATNLYEKKETHWKIKDNVLYIGKKRYYLAENMYTFIE